MAETEFSPSPENSNEQDILDQVADLMSELDGKQADMDANVIDQANAAAEGGIKSAEVADILEDKLIVVFEGVVERLKTIVAERKSVRAEVSAAINNNDETAANSIDTKPHEEERQEANRITRNIINYMNQRSEMPAPDREHATRVLLQDIQEFFEMRKSR